MELKFLVVLNIHYFGILLRVEGVKRVGSIADSYYMVKLKLMKEYYVKSLHTLIESLSGKFVRMVVNY